MYFYVLLHTFLYFYILLCTFTYFMYFYILYVVLDTFTYFYLSLLTSLTFMHFYNLPTVYTFMQLCTLSSNFVPCCANLHTFKQLCALLCKFAHFSIIFVTLAKLPHTFSYILKHSQFFFDFFILSKLLEHFLILFKL